MSNPFGSRGTIPIPQPKGTSNATIDEYSMGSKYRSASYANARYAVIQLNPTMLESVLRRADNSDEVAKRVNDKDGSPKTPANLASLLALVLMVSIQKSSEAADKKAIDAMFTCLTEKYNASLSVRWVTEALAIKIPDSSLATFASRCKERGVKLNAEDLALLVKHAEARIQSTDNDKKVSPTTVTALREVNTPAATKGTLFGDTKASAATTSSKDTAANKPGQPGI